MNIIDIFYNDILKEARNGKVDCYFIFNIHFYNNLDNDYTDPMVPILNLDSKEKFNELLMIYVNKAKSHYDFTKYINAFEDNKEYYLNKLIMTLLWSNATYEDFNNPINFLMKQIDFLDNDIFNNFNDEETIGYSEILESEIQVQNNKENIMNETPYSIQISLTDGNETYYFPVIRYGISNDTCYIYAIQNELESDNDIKKKINRKLFKIGENFNNEEDNLKDVTSSFVVSLNIFLGLLSNKGITKIEVPSILIERWLGKEKYIDEKGNSLERKGINSEEYVNNEKDKHISIQTNLTEKFIRTFLRVIYHHKDFSISSYPFDIDSNLHFDICESNECNNSLLNETFLIASGYKNNKSMI